MNIGVFWKRESRPIEWRQCLNSTRQLFFFVCTSIVYAVNSPSVEQLKIRIRETQNTKGEATFGINYHQHSHLVFEHLEQLDDKVSRSGRNVVHLAGEERRSVADVGRVGRDLVAEEVAADHFFDNGDHVLVHVRVRQELYVRLFQRQTKGGGRMKGSVERVAFLATILAKDQTFPMRKNSYIGTWTLVQVSHGWEQD